MRRDERPFTSLRFSRMTLALIATGWCATNVAVVAVLGRSGRRRSVR
jgi:hypothetical protein